MSLGKTKLQLNNSMLSIICIVFFLLICVNIFTNNKSREGVTFTKFDNRTFFTRPWDNFCIPTAPTCQKDFLEKPGMIGVFPIGCHCEKTAIATSPPAIPDSCYDIDHSYYYK
jgi:hypothetical protein